MLRLLIILISLLTPFQSFDSKKIAKPGVLVNEETGANNIVIPLKRAGNLILIDGKVDGQSGTFILDTGAPGLVLNSTYFRESKPALNGSGQGITGKRMERKSKHVDQFSFAGLIFNNLKADVLNLGHLEDTRKIKILGLIGTAFIRDYEVVIDIRRQSMRMYRIDKKGNYMAPCPDKTKYTIHHDIDFINNVIIAKIPIAGKNLNFCLDTGAEHNVLDFNNHKKVMKTISITSRRKLQGANSETIEVLYGVMNEFSIAGHRFPLMQVVLLDLSSMRSGYGVFIKGMLGYDFFKQGVVRINTRKRMMSIAVN